MPTPEAFSSLSHLLAAPLALAWGLVVVGRRRDVPGVRALALFCIAAVTLLATSGTYHILPRGTPARELLLRLDHTAIWLMIASSFHAVHRLGFEGRWRWVPPTLVWCMAATGIALTALVFEAFSPLAWVVMYVLVGWTGLVSVLRLIAQRRAGIALMFMLGGAFYTAGALGEELFPYAPMLDLVGPHQVFHLCVLAGLAIHGVLLVQLLDSVARTAPGLVGTAADPHVDVGVVAVAVAHDGIAAGPVRPAHQLA